MKRCQRCGVSKPLDMFQVDHRYAGGHQTTCRLCSSMRITEVEQRIRHEVIVALGEICVECGITDTRVLCLDHVKGNGRTDRRKYGSPRLYYVSILTRLEEFQLLCHNCNHLKRLREQEYGPRAVLRDKVR